MAVRRALSGTGRWAASTPHRDVRSIGAGREGLVLFVGGALATSRRGSGCPAERFRGPARLASWTTSRSGGDLPPTPTTFWRPAGQVLPILCDRASLPLRTLRSTRGPVEPWGPRASPRPQRRSRGLRVRCRRSCAIVRPCPYGLSGAPGDRGIRGVRFPSPPTRSRWVLSKTRSGRMREACMSRCARHARRSADDRSPTKHDSRQRISRLSPR